MFKCCIILPEKSQLTVLLIYIRELAKYLTVNSKKKKVPVNIYYDINGMMDKIKDWFCSNWFSNERGIHFKSFSSHDYSQGQYSFDHQQTIIIFYIALLFLLLFHLRFLFCFFNAPSGSFIIQITSVHFLIMNHFM